MAVAQKLVVDREFDLMIGQGGWAFLRNCPPMLGCTVEVTRRGWHGQTFQLLFVSEVSDASFRYQDLWWRSAAGSERPITAAGSGVVLEPGDRSAKDADERFARRGGLRMVDDIKFSEKEVQQAKAQQAAFDRGYVPSAEALTDRACTTCAHYRRRESHDYIPKQVKHRCARPQLGVTRDHVVGADVPNTRDAYTERADNVAGGLGEERCGPEGKFWAQSGF